MTAKVHALEKEVTQKEAELAKRKDLVTAWSAKHADCQQKLGQAIQRLKSMVRSSFPF